MSTYRRSFAQNQLQKHGWEEGKGLGKSGSGIKSAIKVKVKNNKGGLGHDAGSEFTFHWWDHIFNKAANTIEVVNNEENGEVEIKQNKNAKKIVPQLMYNRRPVHHSVTGKPLLYGTFVSAGTITGKEMDSSANTPEGSSDESDTDSEEEELSTDLLDRTFKKTGLTGHKGARHGFKLSGKLKRIQEQEAQNNTKTDCIEPEKEETTKKKKKKSKKESNCEIVEQDDEGKDTSEAKKKEKNLKGSKIDIHVEKRTEEPKIKKKKNKKESDSEVVEQLDDKKKNSENTLKVKKKKRNLKELENNIQIEEQTEEPQIKRKKSNVEAKIVDTVVEVVKMKTKKKKKKKVSEE